ncbi:MAG: Heparinase family protein [Paenibacillus sp.]|nr:Heparinase family protein [Paenibacillus sp.]
MHTGQEKKAPRTNGHLYPVYLAHEKDSGRHAQPSAPFLEADVQFRKKKTALEPTNHRIGFIAYTERDDLVVRVEYEPMAAGGGGQGEVILYFDRGSTRRKRHNLFGLRVKPDGSLVYEEHNYEIETLELPPAIRYRLGSDGKLQHAEFRLSLSHLRIRSEDDRVIGFNVVRILNGPDSANNLSGEFVSWSGIPGDRPAGGVGNGDLLLTRGLDDEQIIDWKEKVQAYGSTHFLQWEKRDIPDEIYELTARKRRGFTGRLSRDDVANARIKADSTEWGRAMKREIVEIADFWAAKNDDELFDLVPVGNPRALSVGQFFGDPLHGGKRTAYQVCLERPYHYYSPVTKTWWHNGMTLTNPTTGERIVLEDDGGGFVAPEGFPNPGVRYMFTASYRLFLISMLLGKPYCSVLEDKTVWPETTGEKYAAAIPNLAFAYQLTQNRNYAYKALLLAGRLAELVPYMNGNYGSGYYDTVQIAEPTTTECHWLAAYFDALDLLFDAIADVDGDLKTFFAGKPDAEGKTRTKPFCVKTAVDDMIPFVLYSCEIERTRNADWSLRYINLELLLAGYMESGKLMRRVLNEGPYSLKAKVRNNFFRDGRYSYDSFGYIVQICDQVTMMANNNYGFRDDVYFPEAIDMFENPEYGISQVVRYYSRLYCGNLTPMFGDTIADNKEPISDDRRKGKFVYSQAFEIAFARMKSLRGVLGPVLAQYDAEELLSYRVRSLFRTNVKHSMLVLALAAEWDEYQSYKGQGSNIQPSFLVEDSETSVLRAGTDARNCKHVVLYGQPSAGHKHGDKLGLWIGAYGYHLMSAVGGYPFTWLSPKFDAWEIHSAACTVALIDGKNQEPSYSKLRCHYEGEWLQVSGMENSTAYPGSHYERSCMLVQAPDRENAYVVDLVYLSGGGSFNYNTMGLDTSFDQVRFEGIADADWIPMKGTLAGEDVPLYSEPGYGWMKALRKARTDRPVSWTYRYAGAGLNVRTVPDGEAREIICCLGERGGEEMGKSRWEPFVLWRDAAEEADRRSVFAAVLEPFERKGGDAGDKDGDGEFLASVRPLTLRGHESRSARYKPVGMEIRYRDGRHTDIVIAVHEEGGKAAFVDSDGSEYTTDAKALLVRYRDGVPIALEAVGCSVVAGDSFDIARNGQTVYGTVVATDLDRREIQVELSGSLEEECMRWLPGQVALIDSPDYDKPSSYVLRDVSRQGNRLTFRSGISLINLDSDWKQPYKRMGLGTKRSVSYEGKPVVVDVKPGDSFRVWNSLRQTFRSHDGLGEEGSE